MTILDDIYEPMCRGPHLDPNVDRDEEYERLLHDSEYEEWHEAHQDEHAREVIRKTYTKLDQRIRLPLDLLLTCRTSIFKELYMKNILQYLFDETNDSLKAQRENQSTKSAASPFFRYKQMDAGQSTTVRFLPAGPGLAPGLNFLVEKRIVRLRFADPNDEKNEISLSFRPMYVKTADDPVMSQVQAIYKEADAEEKVGHDARAKQLRSTASRHWVKPEFFAQGFVVRPGMKEDNIPENPIRIFELSKQLVNKIRTAINSDDPDTMLAGSPEHGTKGTPFIIKKTMTGDGKWPSYTESGFGNKPSALSEDQKAAIVKYNLFNLTEFLPKIPDEDEYELLAEIMAQSLAGDRLWKPEWEARLKVSTI